MNIFKRFFSNIGKKKDGKSDFTIEFYPITGRFYPKFHNMYLILRNGTGIVETCPSYVFAYAVYGETEDDADKYIELYKEQQLKKNIITIKK